MPSKPERPLGERSLDGYILRDDLAGSHHGTLPFTVADVAAGGAFGGSASYPQRHVKAQSQPTASDMTFNDVVATPFTAVLLTSIAVIANPALQVGSSGEFQCFCIFLGDLTLPIDAQ